MKIRRGTFTQLPVCMHAFHSTATVPALPNGASAVSDTVDDAEIGP